MAIVELEVNDYLALPFDAKEHYHGPSPQGSYNGFARKLETSVLSWPELVHTSSGNLKQWKLAHAAGDEEELPWATLPLPLSSTRRRDT